MTVCFRQRVYEQLAQLHALLSKDYATNRDIMLFNALLREQFWHNVVEWLNRSIVALESAHNSSTVDGAAESLPWRHIEAFLASLVRLNVLILFEARLRS